MTLRPLTALRFPAALAVFMWHAPLTEPWARPLSLGYLGVGFFFILSGFILTYTYRGAFSLRAFYVARFARVYPVHLFSMIVAVAVLLTAGGGPEWNLAPAGERAAAIALQSVLLQSWFPAAAIHFGGNGPAWSLSDEAFFYALFPFALIALSRAFRTSGAAGVLLAAAAVWALLTAILSTVHARFDEWAVYIFPPARLADFAIGMLLGLAFLRLPARGRPHATLREVAALCAFGAGLAIAAFAPQSLQFSAAMMPFSALVIFVFAMQGGGISKRLSHPWAVRLGEASYAFYLLHRPVVERVAYWGIGGIAGFACALTLTTGISLAVFAYLETPLRHAIRRWGARRTSAARPAPLPAVPAVSQVR